MPLPSDDIKAMGEIRREYTGQPISLELVDADVKQVFGVFHEMSGLNFVLDPGVSGTVTIVVDQVPWDQALDVILKNNGLSMQMEGNVVRVAPVTKLAQEAQQKRQLWENQELEAPPVTITRTLSYARAKDIEKVVRDAIISTKGRVVIDERTNTLVIRDVPGRLSSIEGLMAVLDAETPQVMIEARIVEASSNFVRNLGIQWGFRGVADQYYGNATNLQFPNSILVDGAQIPVGTVTKGIGGPLGGYAVNLPAPAFNTVLGFSFANVLDTFRVDVAISALETAGDGKIISRPSVVTQNNQQAEIIQGRQIPVQTVANFTVTTRYVNAALELRATPQITAEGTIIMTIEIQNNAADFANLVNGIPPITMQSAKTTVMVPDGGTTVIGGIYRTEDSVTRERVPFLHQIPILGNIFKNFARTKTSRELLIFITPRIIK